mmetsp:Transcript_32694/g.75250  ORF Transcript_32694/g.75250 Transcript_32694/m.75250 type:complete len:110 (-) Transcript_32694:157-486(-)|eukprot:CAMPEP_0113309116 /NCGR_PEP_ID=MMETSP0010_2-20120614/7292_1 /TAXON_ID=216773 ORGANISM="Corethron hystrix, Strain 308" /NCGR_SAMPLE_ID=MMETSP0010_2 /ASSEMBLY_ACC=CAM_ASM_000155 /LENGTH=109 /DNA_ID=CAMNT_0000164311 /DNA_START=79 /DNA_END=408 /DNA_ORIENTATION=+ /assembly_acc=CAM_ASM_000155
MTKSNDNKRRDKSDGSGSNATVASSASSSATPSVPANAAQHILEALEEDDEFEEFLTDGRDDGVVGEDDEEEVAQWQDNWDDDDIEDDFTKTLRAELEASGAKFASAAK